MDIVNIRLLKQKKLGQKIKKVEESYWEWIFTKVWLPCNVCSINLLEENDPVKLQELLCEECVQKYVYFRRVWLLILNAMDL